MIVRILTARVRERNAPKFEAILRQQLPKMREHEGLVYLKLARQVHRGYENVMLFEEWRDSEALHEWTGGALAVPRLLPGAEELVENIAVTHYEALDMDLEALAALPPTADIPAPVPVTRARHRPVAPLDPDDPEAPPDEVEPTSEGDGVPPRAAG